MRLFCVVIVCIVSILALVPQAAVAQIPSTLGWYQIPNSKLSQVCPSGTYPACLNVGAYSGGTMDTTRNRMIVWGGGHDDYGGNEVYAFDMNTLTPMRLTASGPGACTMDSCDGGITPDSRHTYAELAYMPNVDRMF